jgi:hypothetical protein
MIEETAHQLGGERMARLLRQKQGSNSSFSSKGREFTPSFLSVSRPLIYGLFWKILPKLKAS